MKNTLKKITIWILTIEAKLALKRYKPNIIAVTGSVGKTSTKDAIFTAISPFFHVRKSSKSYNGDIGIPLTILGLENPWNNYFKWIQNIFRGALVLLKRGNYPEYLVLEIGADRPGEIKRLMKWIHPDISVVTRVGEVPVHVEFYKSVSDVVKEKGEIIKGLKPDGFSILNADDGDVRDMRHLTNAKTITFGIKNKADISVTYPTITYDDAGHITGVSAKIDVLGNSFPVVIKGSLGVQQIYPVAASFALASAKNLNLLEVANSFLHHNVPQGRVKILKGINDSTIIDDTYNSSPAAVEEGLNILKDVQTKGKKIAILGDMLELGKHSSDEHRRVGEIAGKVADIVIGVGIRAREIANAAQVAGVSKENVYFIEDAKQAGETASRLIGKHDIVYVKGSQGMRMERTVEQIMEEKDKKSELLVRQEKDWLER
ncbi:MAG: UDP-N-acetylmuramoyl-tripeptide--D-alanyl-D-alanine ligase [bacterium]